MRFLPLILALAATPAAAQLAVVDARFEDVDRMVLRQAQYPAGYTMYLTFRIAGFKPDPEQRVRLAYFIDCLDPQKIPLTETLDQKIEQTLSAQDEKWRPKVDWTLPIPSFAPSGEYHVLIRVRDEIAGRETSHPMTFAVKGVAIESSETLVVRDFQFADEENGKAKTAPVYAPGSTLWARFRVVGFRVGSDKQFEVEEDLTVLDAEGKVMFSVPKAAVEKHKMFYPPRFLPATFNLDLEKKLKPGEYTIRLDVRDVLGKQSTTFETKFTVRE